MSKRYRIIFVGVLVLVTGLYLSELAGRSNSHLVLPIILVTCSSYGLVYAVGFGAVSKRLASVFFGIALVGSILAYYYLGRFTSIWDVFIIFAIFLLLAAILYLADVGKIREKMSSKQSERNP